jgi:N-acetylglucosaminyldiphosphoundecaprenol N-acetyl-beta-D-mannosaminyltransferase
MENLEITRFRLLGAPIAGTNLPSAIQAVISWIQRGDRGRTVTFSNVHVLVEGVRNPKFSKMLRESDLNFPDGMPLVWCGRKKVGKNVRRVSGPDFLPAFCAATAHMNLRHFFYGGRDGVAAKAAEELQKKNPGMCVAGHYSPPFRPLTREEDEEIVRSINATRPDVVWVSLGCPKQEIWVDEHRNSLDVPVLLAVGLALDIAAGSKSRAPHLLRKYGMEWAYRLFQEPRRLWKRYVLYNSIFLFRLMLETLQPSKEALPPAMSSETKA